VESNKKLKDAPDNRREIVNYPEEDRATTFPHLIPNQIRPGSDLITAENRTGGDF